MGKAINAIIFVAAVLTIGILVGWAINDAWGIHTPYINPGDRPDLYSYYHGYYGSNPDFYYYGSPYYPFDPYAQYYRSPYGHYPDDGHDKHQISVREYYLYNYALNPLGALQYYNPYGIPRYDQYGQAYQAIYPHGQYAQGTITQQFHDPYKVIPVQVNSVVRMSGVYAHTIPVLSVSQSGSSTFVVTLQNNTPYPVMLDDHSVDFGASFGRVVDPFHQNTYVISPYGILRLQFTYYAPDDFQHIFRDDISLLFSPYIQQEKIHY